MASRVCRALMIWLCFEAGLVSASERAESNRYHEKRAVAEGTALRIIPVGDSITEGYQSSDKNGYRQDLFNELAVSGSTSVDFIGTQSYGNNAGAANHFEGYPGFRISQIQTKLLASGALSQNPNVILLQAGTNDIVLPPIADEPYTLAPARLGVLMANILCAAPDAVLLVAKIPQLANATYAAEAKIYNDAIPAFADALVAKGFKVAVVDNSDVGEPNLSPDGIHPDDEGYAIIATNWFHGLQSLPSGWVQPPEKLGILEAAGNNPTYCASIQCSGGDWQCWWQKLQSKRRLQKLRTDRILSI